MEAVFHHGNPVMSDYTPVGAIAAGEVVVVGDRPCVCHRAIEAGKLGALAVGGGVYQCAGDAAIAAGKKVWWNSTANQVTETRSTHRVFGYIEPGSSCSGAAALCYVVHDPGSDEIV